MPQKKLPSVLNCGSWARVAIDPWTGGALDQYLFSEDAHYSGWLVLDLQIRPPAAASADDDDQEAALGLLILALRDLWEGRLPIGGESGIGRGLLRGLDGQISYRGQTETLQFQDGRLLAGGTPFAAWVQALRQALVSGQPDQKETRP
jgi:hypothetical protein